MAAAKIKSNSRAGNLLRSRSEGTLIDIDENVTINNNNLHGGYGYEMGKTSEWPVLPNEIENPKQTTNPFWNQLGRSNPFLNEIVHASTYDSGVSMLKEDPLSLFDSINEDSLSTSSDETNFAHLLAPRQNNLNRSGRWRSASDILDSLEKKEDKRTMRLNSQEPYMNPDFEWLKNDREAYKMAWLSHRQLTRSCLDLSRMKQSPGWAQTQATDIQIFCKIDHNGGSVQLPDSNITAHIPQGHVPPGEIQEIGLRVLLDPPTGINNNYTTTLSPLLEVSLSNHNVSGSISLEMRMAAKVKSDPTSHVLTSFVGLVSQRKEGPYQKIKDCYIYNDMLQMKLFDLKPRMYVITAAEATVLEQPAMSVWDYLDRHITVAIYGPKHIHPSLKVVLFISSHDNIPPRLPFSDVQRGDRNLPPVVLELWGKHQFNPQGLKDLHIASRVLDSNFEVKPEDLNKEVKQDLLEAGKVLHLPLDLVKVSGGEMRPFKLSIEVKDPKSLTLGDFCVTSPEAAPLRSEKHNHKRADRQREVTRSTPIPEESISEILTQKFQDRPVDLHWYGVAMKSILRQPRMEYLLEYFKGDTIALLSKETIRSLGQVKVKEWYIGFLRGRVGLVHCKNLKVITKDQVIDFTGIKLTTSVLLDNMTIPFKKLTYMYSAIQTLVTDHVKSWRTFAEALGYSEVSINAISRRHAETEAEKVACVLEKLKEDCHAEKIKKKFQHELINGLLKMDVQGVVAHLIQDIVILSTAVELGVRWRELAERVGKLTNAQIAAYEAPHKGKNGEVSAQSMWKPAYDFLYAWSKQYGDGYRDMIQDLHLALDKMKSPVTKQWRAITGALITVNCMEVLRASAFLRDLETTLEAPALHI
ncbi:metastasis-associated in colon cancer protein 1-like isoform X1 [Cyprinus carpio]|uniref:Metastasis-associated in colon cancer protein 1-like isoform X1 n=2 Tax=Cyprinus carpio TaxID=7962 RepID=A0A9Q9VJG3_CYPCA|nr:metastasis-associated in colon cancer protein 1-like isoform X1 [Cyprinus carpio]